MAEDNKDEQNFSLVEGEEKAQAVEAKPQVDMEALLKELEKVNITDPNKLRGKLQNAEGYKTVQAEKDRLKNEVDNLRGEIDRIKMQQQKVDIDEFGDIRSNPIDLEATIAKVYRAERQREKQEQFQQQQAQMAAYQKITGDEYWKQVGPIFEEKMRDPETNMLVQTGQVDPVELYNRTVRDYIADLAVKSRQALQELQKTAQPQAPHVESSARVPTQNLDTRDDKQKKIDELREKAKNPSGLHQDEQMELLNAALGDFIRK